METLILMSKAALLPTAGCLVFAMAYFATKRKIALKIACVFLFVAILAWIPVILVALGILPMPAMRPRQA